MEERGWPGHFIGALRCSFRRNTLLTCSDTRIVVSTVGDMRDDNGNVEEVGCKRCYETMAFQAEEIGHYWDADVSKENKRNKIGNVRILDF